MRLSAATREDEPLVLTAQTRRHVAVERTCGDERSDKDACDYPRNRCCGDALAGATGIDNLRTVAMTVKERL